MDGAVSGSNTVRVELGARSYDIVVGPGLLERAAALLGPILTRPRVIVVTDETVADLYLDRLVGVLSADGIEADSVVLPPGEHTKDFVHLERLAAACLDHGLERGDTLLALGGGVIGDLAGFAAAILLRGVRYVQVPTTLLAQVDSSVGGKTAIDMPHGKNLVGAFHQPALVVADTATLDTLPERHRRAGYAEVVKYGLIRDLAFFEWLEKSGAGVIGGDPAVRATAIVKSCEAKAAVVAADERETGERALLNLGHTFAHAFEAACGYDDRLLHGEAVALGMVLAFELSAKLDLCRTDDAARVRAHIASAGLPTSLAAIAAPDWTADSLVAHMRSDKKVRDSHIAFVLARGIGEAFVAENVEPGAVRGLLGAALDG